MCIDYINIYIGQMSKTYILFSSQEIVHGSFSVLHVYIVLSIVL